MKTKEL